MGAFFQELENAEKNTDYLTGLYNRRGMGELWASLSEGTEVPR